MYFTLQRIIFLVALFSFSCLFVNAQTNSYQKITAKIDSLADAGLPQSALKEVENLDKEARRNNNPAQQIRAAIYRITFISYLKEDALESVIERLKQDIARAEFPAKPVFQSVLAETYWKYYQQNRWNFNHRSTIEKRDTSFRNWDLRTLAREATALYKRSLENESRLRETRVDVLEGILVGDSTSRYLRPTLFDLLAHRSLEFFLTEDWRLPKPVPTFSFNDPGFFADSRTFPNLKFPGLDTNSVVFNAVEVLQRITRFHYDKNNVEALIDITLQRLQFFHKLSDRPDRDTLYLKALTKLAGDTKEYPIQSEVYVNIGRFFWERQSLTEAHKYFQIAKQKYPASFGAKNGEQAIKSITKKELEVECETQVAPGKAILTSVKYRNIKGISCTVYKLSAGEVDKFSQMQEGTSDYTREARKKAREALSYLESFLFTYRDKIPLPVATDYKAHRVENFIDTLQAGYYVAVYKDLELTDSSCIKFTRFQVTNLSALSRWRDGKLEVAALNRETGEPISGAEAEIWEQKPYTTFWSPKTKVAASRTDGAGRARFELRKNINPIVVTRYKGDAYENRFYANFDNNEPATEERTVLFTDRNIYRPGQTIYFKGIEVLVAKNNSSIIARKDVAVELKDGNDKTLRKETLKTNDFGSFNGAFTIPQNILNGSISIKTAFGSVSLRVEEYKKPTYEIVFLPIKELYRLGDSLKVAGVVKTFAGYGISNARVAVWVNRSVSSFKQSDDNSRFTAYRNEVFRDTIKTGSKGEFSVVFKATDTHPDEKELFHNYRISASATEPSGETRSGATGLSVARSRIRLIIDLPETHIYTDSSQLNIRVANHALVNQKAKINIQIFSLDNGGKVYKSRLWEKPDKFLMGKKEFESYFNSYTYKDEDDFKTWKAEKISEFEINQQSEEPKTKDFNFLDSLPSGVYKLAFFAHGEQGDTVSQVRYVTQISSKITGSPTIANLIIPIKIAGKESESAEFLLGTGGECFALMEIYSGKELRSSERIKIREGMERRKVSISLGDNLTVKFLLVYDNRVYQNSFPITRISEKYPLNVKLVTFRDKLQPGDKEQWKLQIKGEAGEKKVAEVLAGMYDASLDVFSGDHIWNTIPASNFVAAPYYWSDGGFGNSVWALTFFDKSGYFPLLERNYEKLNLFG